MTPPTWRDVEIDARTRKVLRGSVEVLEDGTIRLELPKRLESANATLWGHWREKSRAKKDWATAIRIVLTDAAGLLSIAALGHPLEALGLPPVRGRRRLIVVREVENPRRLIRDRDNLVFGCKHLVDALVKVGLLRDDSRDWLDFPDPVQRVSADGRARTLITIEIPAGETIPLRAKGPTA